MARDVPRLPNPQATSYGRNVLGCCSAGRLATPPFTFRLILHIPDHLLIADRGAVRNEQALGRWPALEQTLLVPLQLQEHEGIVS